MIEAIVIGGNHHNTLGVIRSLGEKGLHPLVIIESKEKHPYVAKSRYIRKSWVVDNEKQVLAVLQEEVGKHGNCPVVIACADNMSSLLDIHYNELSLHYSLPGSREQGRITRLMDKEVMSKLAREIGFKVPSSVASETTIDEDINVPFPWIIKPLLSKNGAKADIERIYSLPEWQDYKNNHKLRVQVQHLIEKNYEYQLIGLSLDSGNKVIIPGVSHVIRPAATTNTGFLHYESLDDSYSDIVRLCKNFLIKTGYSGLFSMEFLRGIDGFDYFMEINFRNDGNAICVTEAGVNLPYIWCLNQTGQKWSIDNKIRPVYVMPEFDDISLVWHGQLSFTQWLKDMHKTDRFMEFNKMDQKPFYSYLYSRIKASVKNIIKF